MSGWLNTCGSARSSQAAEDVDRRQQASILSMDAGYGDNTKFNRDLDRVMGATRQRRAVDPCADRPAVSPSGGADSRPRQSGNGMRHMPLPRAAPLGCALLTVATIWADSALDREAVWKVIARRGREVARARAAPVLGSGHAPGMGCGVCGLVSAGLPCCPRCGSALHGASRTAQPHLGAGDRRGGSLRAGELLSRC